MRTKSFAPFIICTLIIFFAFPAPSLAENQKIKLEAPLFSNLGSFHHPISTKIALAQQFFDQGLILFYAFESGESIRSFREAIRLDPNCAMCYWGLALALGSKNNMPMNGHEKQDGYAAIKKAEQLVSPDNTIESAYIDALSKRYSSYKILDQNPTTAFTHGASLAENNEAKDYAIAMYRVVQMFPKDVDAKSLYVFALFDVNKWHFWSRNGKPEPNTLEIIKTLESIFALDPHNVAANHYYIHVVEQSLHPERALKSADFLSNAVPGAEHLLHMPSHIYFLMGRYHDAVIINQKANEAFKKYQLDCRTQGFEPEINYLYLHNLHFLWSGATMKGQSTLALETAKELVRQIPSSWLEKDNYLQLFIPVLYFAEARFGKWKEIINEQKPDSEFQYAVGIWHYARGMAFAHLNKLNQAENELTQLQEITKQGSVQNNLGTFGEEQLKIAVQVLLATLADKKEQDITMLTHLKKAVELQNNMEYKEPPSWYFPTQEALGYALLKTEHATEAEVIFKQDLKKYPKNAWALFGLAKSLKKLGKHQEANRVEKEFKEAWKYADIVSPIPFSK
jgi:tetratricopeptide (TPR) repeat protein